MKDDDLLDLLTRAARDEAEEAPVDPELTRRLLQARASRGVRLRRHPLGVVAFLAATVALTAWAAPRVHQALLAPTLVSPPAPPPRASSSARLAALPSPAAASAPVAPAAAASSASVAPAASALPPVAARGASSVAGGRADRRAPDQPEEPAVDPLYLAAHRAQFQGGDAAAALAAWDRYLHSPGDKAFAQEALYNRGVNLLRLGRTAEARDALRPFADGVYGRYRQREVRAMMERIAPE